MSDHTNDTYALLRALVDEFVRGEIAGVCTSPGSRSTPLVVCLTETGEVECHSHIDERSAGFFAIGLARATGRPAVIACTSGTAAANYLPAIIEAREARLPLIVLTADRPPELREVGAGQTIDQVKLYGDAVRWYQEIDTVDASPERLRWIRQLACRAIAESEAGPVHLNVQLREPLVEREQAPDLDLQGRPGGAPFTVSKTAAADTGALARWLADKDRGVIVAGEHRDFDSAALGEALGWPVLAGPLSGARHGESAIAHYDLTLRSPAPAPGAVLRVGELPASKALRQWLSALDCPQAMVVSHDQWPDPAGDCEARFQGCEPAGLPRAAPAGWLESWRTEDARIAELIATELGDELSEPNVARVASQVEGTLLVAASMPIRDVETFGGQTKTRIVSNRGANGIDGTIATAFGLAAGGDRTTLLTGDVAFAHDVGSLISGSRLNIPLTIVLVDNGGGGIFDFLPVSGIGDAYEEHVATPPQLDVEHVARGFGAAYDEITSLTSLIAALSSATDGTRILHVRTDRASNLALHRRIAEAASS